MEPSQNQRNFPQPGTREFKFVYMVQMLLKHEIAKALYTGAGNPVLTQSLTEIGAALQNSIIYGPEGAIRISPIDIDTDPLGALGAALKKHFSIKDLIEPKWTQDDLVQLMEESNFLIAATSAVERGPEPAADNGPGNSGNAGTDDNSDNINITNGQDDQYRLLVYLTKVRAWRLTKSLIDDEDEFRLSGGFVQTDAIQVGGDWIDNQMPILGDWNGIFDEDDLTTSLEDEENEDDNDHMEALPHKLIDIPIPAHPSTMTLTLIPSEEDLMSPESAGALGTFVSALFTLGVDVLVGFAVVSGVPLHPSIADLSAEAEQLIKDYAIPGLAGIIRQLFGPELFEMPTVRVETDWTPGSPVQWKAWAWYSDNRTDPHENTGAGEANGDVRVDEITIEIEDNFIKQNVVAGGGTYTMDIKIEVVGV